jgi:3-deoxy-7-phosphoheptulonate synthase
MFNKINGLTDINIQSITHLLTPNYLKSQLPVTNTVTQHVITARNHIADILQGKADRLLLVVGPCSVHDPKAILDYAHKLKTLADAVKDTIQVVMRVYFEKPRTTTGWQGLIKDPYLDNSGNINHGLYLARDILLKINTLGLATATEFIDPIISSYIADLISFGALGARTAESQLHRNLISGLSMPIGIKNSTTGDIKVAIDAMKAALHPNEFLSITDDGLAAIVKTTGNPNLQLILRGGSVTGGNYHKEHILEAILQIEKNNMRPTIMIDCSHGNSNKDYTKQVGVLEAVVAQMSESYGKYINGIMLESFIEAGKQALTNDLTTLEYGKSITDSCISWNETEEIILNLSQVLNKQKQAA